MVLGLGRCSVGLWEWLGGWVGSVERMDQGSLQAWSQWSACGLELEICDVQVAQEGSGIVKSICTILQNR